MAQVAGIVLGAAFVVAGCQDGYPIAATRCDRLCDLVQATFCGNYNPASRVAECEQTTGQARCYSELDQHLSCLEQHRQSITCTGVDWVVPACADTFDKLQRCGEAVHPAASSSQ